MSGQGIIGCQRIRMLNKLPYLWVVSQGGTTRGAFSHQFGPPPSDKKKRKKGSVPYKVVKTDHFQMLPI